MVSVQRELNHAAEKEGGDNYWLVAMEQGMGALPCEEPSAFSEERPLSEKQEETLERYHRSYDELSDVYRDVLDAFGFKPLY